MIMKHEVVLQVLIILLGSCSIQIRGMVKLTQENFIIELHKACTDNNKNGVKELLQQLKTFDYGDKVKSNNNALHVICNALNKNPLLSMVLIFA